MKFKNYEKVIFYILILFVSFILVFNIFNYDPIQGYDAEAHHEYINNFFSMFIPGKSDSLTSSFTREYFSPPLPYFVPATIGAICRDILTSSVDFDRCKEVYSLFGQVFQTFLYIFSIYFYLLSFKKLYKNKITTNFEILLLFSLLTVNYKTISMIRGEAYIIFFLSIFLYKLLNMFEVSFDYTKLDILFFGLLIGGLALSRQWAFLLFPGLYIAGIFVSNRPQYFKFISYSFIIGFISSSWFYFDLYIQYGTFTSFNADELPFSFSNQPKSFYLPDIQSINLVFTKPIRPNFSNQFFPILYSDLWGDYWGYFSFTSRSLDTGRNQLLIGDYLARVNTVSVFLLFFFLYSIVSFVFDFIKKKSDFKDGFSFYIFISIIFSLLGYLWFLIKYPELKTGDTIKATYLIQMFHLIVFISAQQLIKIKNLNPKVYKFITSTFIFIFFHNLSAMLSHF